MKKHIDKEALVEAIKSSKELTDDQKADIIGLIRTQKKYGLVWEDSPEEAEEILKTQIPILREVEDRAILKDTDEEYHPNHILIEGDNLQALIALTYTHAGKIDVIYIDPPYNTGNKDFIYNDTFVGEDDSYRHSKWLSFMQKRLKIARSLLSEKGVIFMSIDDNEQSNLKLLCDEIFGINNFICTIPWRKRTAKSDVPHGISQDCEWILCYGMEQFKAGVAKETRKYFETPDFPGRPWRIHDLTKQTTAEERPNSFFTIINPKTCKEYPANRNRTWAITQETFWNYYKANRIVFPDDYDFLKITKPMLRYWKYDDEIKAGEMFGYTAVSTYLPKEVGMTQDGTKNIADIFGNKAFGFPKPMNLIKYILDISSFRANNSIILDFFAGSGTTLHATMQLNAEDGGHRQCILVTNNENNICEEVTYERNKRVIEGYTTPKGTFVEGLKNNNLRYYQIGFTDRESTHQSNKQLMVSMKDLLCIKEDIYNPSDNFGTLSLEGKESLLRCFTDGNRQMLMVYDTRVIPFIIREIEKMEKKSSPIKIYLFADGAYPYTEEFRSIIDKVELIPLPYAYRRAIKSVLPDTDPEWVDNAELTEEEQAELMEEAIEAENNESLN